MIDYISGSIAELTPTQVVIDNQGIGYSIEISLQTYSLLEGKSEGKIYIYHHLQSSSDTESFYGFFSKDERSLFELLISVSGVGVNTARVILSSFSTDELRNALISENINAIKSVKGIGLKTAQRMILELKDKVVKGEGTALDVQSVSNRNAVTDEAVSALLMLGFAKPNVVKAVKQILASKPDIKVEELIRAALQIL